MKRVAIYARYSSDAQREASIEDQVRVCRQQAERMGWAVIETLSDHAVSGARSERPAFHRLRDLIAAGQIDIVLAESLDRISRDMEHTAAFAKICRYHGVEIWTASGRELSEIELGIQSAMNSVYLKDLAAKTRRGLEGRVLAGRSIGAPAYGYDVVRRMSGTGDLDRGLRAINPAEAAVVRRIFQAFAEGHSPRRIATELNREGVPGPGNGPWYDATIRGRPKRGDGLLRNPIYVGQLVWGARINLKDPVNGALRRRYAKPDERIVSEVPALRIIDDALWERVQRRLLAQAAPVRADHSGPGQEAFWDRRRPQHLLTGKVYCGCCGHPFSALGKDYLGCKPARHGGCRNTRPVRRGPLETWVIDALGRQLSPDLLSEFIPAFNEVWRQLLAEHQQKASGRVRERAALDRRIDNLVEAIADGRSSPALLRKLDELEIQRARLGEAEAPQETLPPALHPGIATLYRDRVQALQRALASARDPEILEAARALIDQVIISPPDNDDEPPRIELVGELTAMLKVAGLEGDLATSRTSKSAEILDMFASSVKAGPGGSAPWPFRPLTQLRCRDRASRGRRSGCRGRRWRGWRFRCG